MYTYTYHRRWEGWEAVPEKTVPGFSAAALRLLLYYVYDDYDIGITYNTDLVIIRITYITASCWIIMIIIIIIIVNIIIIISSSSNTYYY